MTQHLGPPSGGYPSDPGSSGGYRPPGRSPWGSPVVLIAIAAGVLVLVAGVIAALVFIPSSDSSKTTDTAGASASTTVAAPSTTYTTITPPTQQQAPPTTTTTTTHPQPSVDGADWQGFLDGPRCNAAGDQAVAIGQTSRSRVVICQVGEAGGLYYKGSADGNGIEIQDPARNGNTFVAINKGVTYVVSPQQLSINQNGENLSTEPMLAYWSN